MIPLCSWVFDWLSIPILITYYLGYSHTEHTITFGLLWVGVGIKPIRPMSSLKCSVVQCHIKQSYQYMKMHNSRTWLYGTQDITNPRYIEQFLLPFDFICLSKHSNIKNPRYIEPISVSLECLK